MPQIRHDYVANLGKRLNWRKDVLVSETVNYCSNKKTEETGNDIVELAFAATGGASTRSVSGEGHADPKDQPADNVTDDVSGRHNRENDPTHAAQPVKAQH